MAEIKYEFDELDEELFLWREMMLRSWREHEVLMRDQYTNAPDGPEWHELNHPTK